MYNYLYKFHLLKPASANSQVTLVTSSGAFKNPIFRKVWFYLIKRLVLEANVFKTLRTASAAHAAGSALAGPWREPSGTFSYFLHFLGTQARFFT